MDNCHATSTAELLLIKPGALAVCATLILQAVDGPFEKINQKGKAFSWAILKCCNEAEERVKVVIFSPLADSVQQDFELHSLIRFEGFEAKPIMDPNDVKRRYGSLDFELLGGFSSSMHLVRPNYRPSKGMPYSTVAEIDFTKPLSRHKLCAVLLSDMRAYGKGLVGDARLTDSTGTLDVQLRILQVAPVQMTVFRSGSKLILKGSLSKCYEVINFVVDVSSDVDFLDKDAVDNPVLRLPFKENGGEVVASNNLPESPPSLAQQRAPSKSTGILLTSSEQRCLPSTSQAHQKKKVSGLLVVDFERTSVGLQGLLYANRATYEVHVLEAPEGAESCLADGQEGTFYGYIDGDILTVHFWEDVDIYGAEKFKETVSLEPTSYSSVPDLDVADQSRLHKLRLKLIKVGSFSPSFIFVALLSDINGKRKVLTVKAPSGVVPANKDQLTYGAQLEVVGRVLQEGNELVCTVDEAGRIKYDLGSAQAPIAGGPVKNVQAKSVPSTPTPRSTIGLGRAIKQEKFDANDPANPARFSEGQAARDGVHEEVITIDDSPLVGLKPKTAKTRRAAKKPASDEGAVPDKKRRLNSGNAPLATVASTRTRRGTTMPSTPSVEINQGTPANGEGSTSESSLDATPQCESTLLFGKDDAIVSESNTLAVGEANSAGSQQEREIV